MVEQEFPSVQYFYNEQRRHGARIERYAARIPSASIWINCWRRLNENTLLVPISQVCSQLVHRKCARHH